MPERPGLLRNPHQARQARDQAALRGDGRERARARADVPNVINVEEIADGTLAHAELFDANGDLFVGLPTFPDSGLTFPWREYLGPDKGYTQGWAIGNDSLQFTFTIECLWRDFILGVVEEAIFGKTVVLGQAPDPLKLSRVPPWTCPIDTTYVATKIVNVEGIQFLGQWAFAPLSYYRLARMTVLFQKVPYRILSDSELMQPPYDSKEWRRWTFRRSKGSGEFLTRDKFELNWAQGAAGEEQAQGFGLVPVGQGQLICKEMLDFHWLDVPGVALFGSLLEGRAANQLNGVGKVNVATFLSYPVETLLLESVEFQERLQPIPRGVAQVGAKDPTLAYDAMFHFLYLDPPAVKPARAAGHNVTPFPQEEKWRAITPKGLLGDRSVNDTTRLHGFYDFEKLFVPNA